MTTTSELVKQISSLNISDASFPLFDLPELARNAALRYLRLWELMDLRLVSKTTKKWVDESHLDKFLVCIKSHQQIEEITTNDSSPKWSEIKILCDSEMHNQDWIENPLYINLLQKLGPTLSTLILEGHRLSHIGLVTIISTCKKLRRLEFGILDCKNWSTNLLPHEANDCLQNLEHLSMEYLAWNEEYDLELFQNILNPCNSLVSLKAPHILMASLFKIGDTDDEDTDQKYLELVVRRLVNPIVQYIKAGSTKHSAVKQQHSLKQLDVQNLHHTEIFPGLAGTCHLANIRLLNVSEAFEQAVPAIEVPFIDSIESLNGFTDHLDFHKLVNLKAIILDSETSADSAVGKQYIEAKLSKLKLLEFCLPEDIDASIISCLLNQPRASITALKIEFEVEEPKLSNLLQISDIANNFRHLQELSLIKWDGNDKDLITLLKAVPRLRCLRLQRCAKITDMGLIGDTSSHPLILSLKDLKKLWLDCCISDAILRDVISQLQLEEFFYASPLITLSGLSALAKGPFGNSVIVFEGGQPDNCSDEDFEAVWRSFKNLKRSPNYL